MNPCISTHTLYITFFYLLTNYAIKFNGFYFFFMQTLWTLLHIFTLTTFMYMLLNVTSLMGRFWTHNVLKIIMQGLFLYFICYRILNQSGCIIWRIYPEIRYKKCFTYQCVVFPPICHQARMCNIFGQWFSWFYHWWNRRRHSSWSLLYLTNIPSIFWVFSLLFCHLKHPKTQQ